MQMVSHILPISYIGQSAQPRCFRTGQYNHLKDRYGNQANGWMDSTKFEQWLKWWYSKVTQTSNGPWLLIIDNCGGHEHDINLPGVRIELLPPRSTAKYQPLDLGLIAHAKIRYRSLLLRMSIDVILRRTHENQPFPASSQRGMLGIQHGFLPHVGDAMTIFDEAWAETSRVTVMKCWIKSKVYT